LRSLWKSAVAFFELDNIKFLCCDFWLCESCDFSEAVLDADSSFSLPLEKLFLFWLETFLHR
jgi:hypothetical protein